jgi:hypothetical protein
MISLGMAWSLAHLGFLSLYSSSRHEEETEIGYKVTITYRRRQQQPGKTTTYLYTGVKQPAQPTTQ